jgi:subfamily B ATP-binding cassette protein MsbA
MKTYFRILFYAKPFGKNIPLYLLFTVFYIVFSMINFSVLIPLLEVLFNQIDEQTTLNYTEIGNFQISLEYFKSIFYNNFNKIVESGGRKEALKFVCIVIVASVFFSNFFRYLSAVIIAKIRVKIVTNIRNQLFNKILSFKINFFTNNKKGDVVSRLTSDIQQIENSVINSIRVLFKEPALLLGLFFILSTISIELTLYTIFLIPISGAIISYIAKHLKIKATYSQNALGRINNVISESLDGIRIIKLFTANWFVNKKFKEEVYDYGKQNLSMYKRFELASPISEFLGVATVAGILLIGGGMVLDKSSDISASEFIAFIIIFSQVLNPAKAISDAFNTIQRGLASADRTFEYVDKTIIVEEEDGTQKIEKLESKITFNNVSFAYETDKVLDKISFNIKKGEKIALIGPSGSGKSTIIDLLSKFYKVKKGEIKIDGKNINTYDTYSLRTMMGVVTQESIVFHDTITNNITFGNKNINMEKIINAAKIANAYDFINKLENKFDTIIGERGLKLSGGQRQRLCIARAIYKNPPILILDEATSSLDSESEKVVQNAIENVMKNRTSIIIAHRLSTVINVDKIILIDEGKIIGIGNHKDLIKNSEMYKKLIQMQNLN